MGSPRWAVRILVQGALLRSDCRHAGALKRSGFIPLQSRKAGTKSRLPRKYKSSFTRFQSMLRFCEASRPNAHAKWKSIIFDTRDDGSLSASKRSIIVLKKAPPKVWVESQYSQAS